MRLALAVVLLAACSSKQGAPQRLVDRAAQIELELSDDAHEKAIADVMKQPPENLVWQRKPLKYPVDDVVVRCGNEMVRAMYNPYQDLLVIGAAADDTAGESVRVIYFDDKKVWSNPKKATSNATDMGDGLAIIMDKPIEEELESNSESLDDLSTKYAAWFPPDRDVSYELRIATQADAIVEGGRFRTEKREHRGWKLAMHSFSPTMRADIVEHGRSVDRLTAELFVLERYNGELAEMKSYDDAKLAPVILHHEKLKARAEALLDASKDIPHAKYRLSLVHVTACQTTAAN